jgi:hypothetical protein
MAQRTGLVVVGLLAMGAGIFGQSGEDPAALASDVRRRR